MKNFINDLWLGKIALPKTYWRLVIFILLYFYIIHSKILYDGSLGFVYEGSLGFYIFADILGVVLSFFILASVWRAADKYKANKLWPILSKISAIGFEYAVRQIIDFFPFFFKIFLIFFLNILRD